MNEKMAEMISGCSVLDGCGRSGRLACHNSCGPSAHGEKIAAFGDDRKGLAGAASPGSYMG
jgi:hypothetical protein